MRVDPKPIPWCPYKKEKFKHSNRCVGEDNIECHPHAKECLRPLEAEKSLVQMLSHRPQKNQPYQYPDLRFHNFRVHV